MDEENKVPKNTGEEQSEAQSAEKEVPAKDEQAVSDVQEEVNEAEASPDADETEQSEGSSREVHYEERNYNHHGWFGNYYGCLACI